MPVKHTRSSIVGLFILLGLFYQINTAFGQQIIIRSDREGNIVYPGIYNPLTILVEGYKCNSIVLKSKNATIEYNGACHFNYSTNKTKGADTISVFVKSNNKLKRIGETFVFARNLPTPLATIGGLPNGDTISIGTFKAQPGIGAYQNCCGFDLKFTIIQFHLIIIRYDKVIFSEVRNGNAWTKEMRVIFNKLESGDKILVTGIVGKGAEGTNSDLLPLQYILK